MTRLSKEEIDRLCEGQHLLRSGGEHGREALRHFALAVLWGLALAAVIWATA